MSGMSEIDVPPTPARNGQPDLALRVEVRLTDNISIGGRYTTYAHVKCDPGYMADSQGVVSRTKVTDVAVYHVVDLLRILDKQLDRLSKRHPPLDAKDIPCIIFKSLMAISPSWRAQDDGWEEFEPTPPDQAAFSQTLNATTSEFSRRWGPDAQTDGSLSDTTPLDWSPRRRPRVSSI